VFNIAGIFPLSHFIIARKENHFYLEVLLLPVCG